MSVVRRVATLACASALVSCTPLDPVSEPDASAPAYPSDDGGGPPLQAVAPEPVQAVPTDVVSASVIPQHAVLAGRSGSLNLMIELAGEGDVGPRPPLDLAIVIDRSGSMGGDKIAAVKTAAIEMLDELNAEDDVTLVTYASDVTVHGERGAADERGRQRLRDEILRIEATTGTALGPALFQSLAVLGAVERPDEVMAHVLLLSDGMANEGESDPNVIAARARESFGHGISTSTLGVGLDYNEDLMTKVADAGGGRYHFIEDADAVRRVLADEMAGLAATVARGIAIEMTPAPGLEVERVFGYETTREGDHVSALVGSLAAQQKRAILLRVQHPAVAGDSLALGEMTVAFVDATTGRPRTLVLDPVVPVVQTEAAVRDSEAVPVTVRVAEVEASDRIRLAADALENRRFDEARGSLQTAIDDLERQNAATPSKDLEQQIDMMEDALQDVGEAERDEKVLRRSKKSFKAKAYDAYKD